jgi:hypothetical protein
MRIGQLRSLLKELRAGGVSEYTTTKRGETLTLKLSGPFPPSVSISSSARKAAAKAAATFPPISSELRKQFEALGVDVDQANEVIRDVGIAAGVGDGG